MSEIGEQVDDGLVADGGIVAASPHGGAESGPCSGFALRIGQ
jgi:hypothetical protein